MLHRISLVGPGSRLGLRLRHSTGSLAFQPAPHEPTSGQSANMDFKEARPFNQIPGPKGLPYVGTLLQYKRGPFKVDRYQDAVLARYREFGPIYKETIAGDTIVHLLDPDYIKIVYLHEGKIPHIPPLLATTQMYRKYRNLSPGLGNTNGEEWYRLRSAVQQMMMRPKAVTMYLPQVNEVADDFIPRLKSIHVSATGQVENFTNEVLKWNLESSGATCFETRFGCFKANPDSHQQKMIDANQAVFTWSFRLLWSFPWYKITRTPTWKKLVQAEDYFFSNGQRMVDETVGKIQTLVDNGQLKEGQYGFLTYLLARKELTYKDLSIITLSLFGDGLSTTVPSLIGQLYCLAANPEKQEKLYEEVSRVIPPGQPVTADMINSMAYLKACVKEGFRFFPVGVEVSRIPQKDLVIGGYQIPAGTHLQLNNNLLLRLPQYFENPEEYIPERWVRGSSDQNIHPYLLIPFGHGPRMCAGRRFAEQEMYVVIAKLLQNFRLEWPHEEPMGQRYHVLLTPDRPAQFKFVPRH